MTKKSIFFIGLLFLFTYTSCVIHSTTTTSSTTTSSSSKNITTTQTTTTTKTNRSLKSSAPSKGKIEKKYESDFNKFAKNGTEKTVNIGSTTPDKIISTAKSYIGTPHCMGGATKKCMDCSGLLVKTFSTHGIALPHNSQEQARYGKITFDKKELKKGDLVFFANTYKTSAFITHSGIYLGDNTFIHTSSKAGVTITKLDDVYWNDKFVFGTRIF